MKNRILVFIALILTILAVAFFDVKSPIAYSVVAITALAQFWILIKNKTNWGVRIGNYALWLAIVVVAIGLGLGEILPREGGFGPAFSAVILGAMISFGLVCVSSISFIIGAFLKNKTPVASINA